MDDWHLYLIRTTYGALYTGITKDIGLRFAEHQSDSNNGAKALRSKGPLQLVYGVKIGSHRLALKAEAVIKKRSKAYKETLVSANPDRDELLEILKMNGF